MSLADRIRGRQSAQLIAAAREDFGVYCAAVFRGYQTPRHLRVLHETLASVEAGQIDRLAVSKPPRHGGTLTVSQLFPCWVLGRHPDWNIALCWYGSELAFDGGRKVQQTLQSRAHQAIFPEARLSRDVGSAGNIELEAGGHLYSVSRNEPLTGRGCHVLICDDLLKDAAEAASPVIRKQLHDWYTHVGLTRLTQDGRVISVSTRWHADDLNGRVTSEPSEKPWTVLNFTAIALEGDFLGREVGEPLWPQRFDRRYLARRRAEMGSRGFTALYMGAPSEAEGNIFKRDQWRFYYELPSLKRIVVSTDTAFKEKTTNDYSARQVWGEGLNGYFLLHASRARMAYPDLRRGLISLCEQWKPEVVLIEDAASGQSLLQELRETTALPLKPIRPDRDKIARAEAVTPLLEAGRVFLPDPQSAPWVNDFLDEASAFPNGQFDDQVDACTMALNYLRGGQGWGFDPEMVARLWLGVKKVVAKVLPTSDTAQDAEQSVAGAPAAPAACPQCGNRGLGASIEKGVWCTCGWRRSLDGDEARRLLDGAPAVLPPQPPDPAIMRQIDARVAIGAATSPGGRTFGAQRVPIAAAKDVVTPSRAETPFCPTCGAALARRESARGDKLETCNACGWANTIAPTNTPRLDGRI
jgi:predicted phage terminase large subunit-like protein